MKRRLALVFAVLATPLVAKPKPPTPTGISTTAAVSEITPPKPIGDPAEWITSDDYPAEAMRNGEAGDVKVTLAIDETGKVVDCSVTEPSGHQTLDDATCAVMMARARFAPAYDGQSRPVPSTFHRMVRWALPGGSDVHEIWTVDQIRFPPPKNDRGLNSLIDDHSMEAVATRLKALDINFERSTVEINTATLSAYEVEKIEELKATEPFVLPRSGYATVNVITSRKPAYDGSVARPVPLVSPSSAQIVITYDVTPDGKPGNCTTRGEDLPIVASYLHVCEFLETRKPNFSLDPTGTTRHVTMTLSVSVKSTTEKPSSSATK